MVVGRAWYATILVALMGCTTIEMVKIDESPDGQSHEELLGSRFPDAKNAKVDTIFCVGSDDRDFNPGGYKVHDTVPEVKLFTPDGELFSLDSALQSHEYVLLFSGSYTCGMFNNTIHSMKLFPPKFEPVKFVMVYIVDAHPVDDPSPYTCRPWPYSEQDEDYQNYGQPSTYGARAKIAQDMIEGLDINTDQITVVVDNADNDWWMNFGMGPNMGYLIGPGREVIVKQGVLSPRPLHQLIKNLLISGATN